MSDAREERGRTADVLRRALALLDAAAPDAAADWTELSALASALADAVAHATGAAATAPPTPADMAAPSHLIHDMRSAGGTLLTWCHLLRRGTLTAEQMAHGISVLERTVRRQLALVEQLAAERTTGRAPSVDGEPAAARLPTASAPSDAPPAERAGAVDLGGLRILIVDDDADARESMRMILAPLGAEVVTAISAVDAFDVLQQGRPDLLISDIVMPDADGYALLRRVRAPDTGERGVIPAIAVTGSARPEDRQRAFGAGYQLHLTKPFDARALIVAVRALTGR